jgi:hypothetical protein
VAARKPCDDFPQPKEPAQLSPYRGEHTASRSSSDDDGDGTYYDYAPDDGAAPEEDADGDAGAYAPGLQEGAEPADGGGGGGNRDRNDN